MAKIRLSLLQHTHQIPLHILVDFAIAGEGAAAFFVAAEGSNQIRVLDLFVEVAHKAATGQVGGCDFIERADLRPRPGIPPMTCWKQKSRPSAETTSGTKRMIISLLIFRTLTRKSHSR